MSQGQKGAENIKSVFHQTDGASESLRKNINSFADDLLSGNKHHTNTHQHGSTGIHPDAQKTGDAIAEGTGAIVDKAENVIDKHKHKQTSP